MTLILWECRKRDAEGSAEWMTKKSAWRRWHFIAWHCACYLFGLRPFGWMNSDKDGKEGCSWQRRQSSGRKVGSAQYAQPGPGWYGWGIWSIAHLRAVAGAGDGEDARGLE